MDIYKVHDIGELIKGNPYVGRGIVVGKSPSGKAAAAYFIMGRSANSRNRVFVERGEDLFTEPYDPSRVEDPSLIIYAAIRSLGDKLIVTNGDQTDTIAEFIKKGKSFGQALKTREFEPDGPNWTPRISAQINFGFGNFDYEMSILKSIDPAGSACSRYYFEYPAVPGLGHFIHTYVSDGEPVPSFQGEPERVAVPDDIELFTETLWNALDPDNKISLYVRYIDIASGAAENRMINRNR